MYQEQSVSSLARSTAMTLSASERELPLQSVSATYGTEPLRSLESDQSSTRRTWKPLPSSIMARLTTSIAPGS